jgi:hypothetical protein
MLASSTIRANTEPCALREHKFLTDDRFADKGSVGHFRAAALSAHVDFDSLEQLGSELAQIVSPIIPSVGALGFLEYDLELVLLEHLDRSTRGCD